MAFSLHQPENGILPCRLFPRWCIPGGTGIPHGHGIALQRNRQVTNIVPLKRARLLNRPGNPDLFFRGGSVSHTFGRPKVASESQRFATIIKAHAKRAGSKSQGYAGHSLGTGFLTSAAENGANLFKLMEVSCHRRSKQSVVACETPICSMPMPRKGCFETKPDALMFSTFSVDNSLHNRPNYKPGAGLWQVTRL